MARSRSDAKETGSPSTTSNPKNVSQIMASKDTTKVQQGFEDAGGDEDELNDRNISQEMSSDHINKLRPSKSIGGMIEASFPSSSLRASTYTGLDKSKYTATSIAPSGSGILSSRFKEQADDEMTTRMDRGSGTANQNWQKLYANNLIVGVLLLVHNY